MGITDEYILPHNFKNIIDEIKTSEDFLNCEIKNKKDLYESTIKFLIDSSLLIYNKIGLVISAPEINLCRDNSIDLSWRKENIRLLVNVKENKNNEFVISYYGDVNKGFEIIKGSSLINNYPQDLIIWMEKL